ncbi:O-antigen ligase family protein [Clostridium sp.]|uniref:O-antigen ligase family protein n=1 Tax=Clostridium sp. TaxID=1506 RepID=UPI003217A9FB
MFNLILLLVLSPYTALFVGVYATYKMVKMRDEIQKNSWNIGLLLLFGWSLIVGIVNKSIMSICASFIFILYFALSIYLQSYCKTEDKLDKISEYLIKFSIFSGIIGIIEKLTFAYFPMELWKKILEVPLEVTSNHRIYSTFGNPNVAGDWFAIMIIVTLYYASISKDKKCKTLYYGATVLFLINLCLTGSRGAFVGLVFGLVSLFLLKKNKSDRIIFCCILLIIAVVGFTPEKISDISQEMTGHEIERSFDTREEIWIGSIKMVDEKPITGWGLVGTIEFGNQYSRYSKVINHSHNIWLSLLTSIGIVGLSIYLFIRANIFKNLIYLYMEDYGSVALLISIQVIILVHGVIDFTIIAPQIGMLFVGTSAIITVFAKENVGVLIKRGSIPV